VPLGAFTRDDDTAEFLDAAARGEFLVRRCDHGHISEPATESCTTCPSRALHWIAASGRARLVSWAVTYSPGADGAQRPHVLAVGELEEGPWWWSCIPGADPEALSVNDALVVGFETPADTEESLPVFRLAR
jgi:hypothetical protein